MPATGRRVPGLKSFLIQNAIVSINLLCMGSLLLISSDQKDEIKHLENVVNGKLTARYWR